MFPIGVMSVQRETAPTDHFPKSAITVQTYAHWSSPTIVTRSSPSVSPGGGTAFNAIVTGILPAPVAATRTGSVISQYDHFIDDGKLLSVPKPLIRHYLCRHGFVVPKLLVPPHKTSSSEVPDSYFVWTLDVTFRRAVGSVPRRKRPWYFPLREIVVMRDGDRCRVTNDRLAIDFQVLAVG